MNRMVIYCGQLGLVEMPYCLSMNEGLPCKNIIGCWKDRTDIIKILKARFSEEELNKIFNSLPKSRIDRILDVIQK